MDGALATIDIDSVIERIANGEYQSHIARQFGIAPQRLHEKVSKHPQYRIALKLRNQSALDESQQRIKDAASRKPKPDLARANAAAQEFRAAAWRAERECPEEWGQHTQVDIGISGELAAALEGIARRRDGIVDGISERVEDKTIPNQDDTA